MEQRPKKHKKETLITRSLRYVLWNIATRLFVNLYLKPLYTIRKDPSVTRLPKPPFVVVANHGTFFDPWIIGVYSWSPWYFMTNDDAFEAGPVTRWYLRLIGAFPKKKGAPDSTALKKTLTFLKQGHPVCIFPEGQTSWDGETQPIYAGVETIVKMARCPLVMFQIEGNFLTKPWWAQFRRKGRISVRCKIISTETVEATPTEVLRSDIIAYLYNNDIKNNRSVKGRFTGRRNAEGLEFFIWKCLKCEKDDMLITHGDQVICQACGQVISIDAECVLHNQPSNHIADLKDWFDWHKQKVQTAIESTALDAPLCSSTGVIIQQRSAGGSYAVVGIAALRLTTTALFITFQDHQTVRAPLIISTITGYSLQRKHIFEFRHQTVHYRFCFDHKSPMKWHCYIRYLKGYARFEQQHFIDG